MSTNLHLEPVVKSSGISLSDHLKFILRKTYEDTPIYVRLSGDSVTKAYFRGLSDAGVQDADKVVQALEGYDEIILKEE